VALLRRLERLAPQILFATLSETYRTCGRPWCPWQRGQKGSQFVRFRAPAAAARAGPHPALIGLSVTLWVLVLTGGGWFAYRHLDRFDPIFTRFPVSTGDTSKSLTVEQKGWALATSAMLTERNQQSHDLLGGTQATAAEVARWKDVLKQWWGVRNRSDLLRTLGWLERAGHRRGFESLGANPSSQSDSGSDPELAHRVEVVRAHYTRLGNKSLLGWDYARFVSLCRWGYLVGYVSEDEAWQWIMPKARELQKTFGSWADLGENYLIGREFWSVEETAIHGWRYRAAYERLLTNPESPWLRFPWDVDLGGGAR